MNFENINASNMSRVGSMDSPLYRGLLFGALFFTIAVFLYWVFKPRAAEVTALGPYALRGVGLEVPKSSRVTLFDVSDLNRTDDDNWFVRFFKNVFGLGAPVSNKLGNNFTLSGFFYMDDVSAERIPQVAAGEFKFKPTLFILGVGSVTLDPIYQKARVRIAPLTNLYGEQKYEDIEIPNVTVAKWHQITIAVLGRSVDVYLNGVLVKSVLLENVPTIYPVGVELETVPDFVGQAGLFQAWPNRLTVSDVARNYKRNTDTRGKPYIPEPTVGLGDLWAKIKDQLCSSAGFCGFSMKTGPLEYIEYEYA